MALIYNEQTGDFEEVQAPPIIKIFRIQESVPFYKGDEITLIWQIDDAIHIYIDGEEQIGNSLKVTLDTIGLKSFTIKAANTDGTTERNIMLDVIPTPTFEIHSSATVLHKGCQEPLIFTWKIKDAKNAVLRDGNRNIDIELTGEITLVPDDDTQYVFIAEGLEGHRVFNHSVPIKLREAAHVKFTASRLFSYPNLPIRLMWDVSNAISVNLEGYGLTTKKGSYEVSPGEDTTYTLIVKDAFGEEKRTLTIRMLPLPAIQQVFVPVPKIEVDLGISYVPPSLNVNIPVPILKSSLIDLGLPIIPRLKYSKYFVSLLSKKKKRKISNPFKSLFSYIYKKQ